MNKIILISENNEINIDTLISDDINSKVDIVIMSREEFSKLGIPVGGNLLKPILEQHFIEPIIEPVAESCEERYGRISGYQHNIRHIKKKKKRK